MAKKAAGGAAGAPKRTPVAPRKGTGTITPQQSAGAAPAPSNNLAAQASAAVDVFAAGRQRFMEEGPGWTELEDGRYRMALVSAKIGRSERSNRRQIVFDWVVTDGEFAGERKRAFEGLETEDSIYFLNIALARLGYQPPENEAELAAICEELGTNHPECRVQLRTKDGSDIQNLRIQKLLADQYDISGLVEEPADGADAPAVDQRPEAEGDDGADDQLTEEEVRSASKTQLQQIVADYQLQIPEGEQKNITAFRAAVAAALFGDPSDPEPEAEAEAEPEPEPEPEPEAEPTINVGDRVQYRSGGKPVTGQVVELIPAEGKARVKQDTDGRVYRVELATAVKL